MAKYHQRFTPFNSKLIGAFLIFDLNVSNATNRP